MKESGFSPNPDVNERSKLAAGLLRSKRQQGCRSPRPSAIATAHSVIENQIDVGIITLHAHHPNR
jgi:hypothetical protein